jgi:hypothetical protein
VSRPPESLVGLIEADTDATGYRSLPAVAQWLLTASEAERLAANSAVRQQLCGLSTVHQSLRLAGVGTASTADQAVEALNAGWDAGPELLVRVLAARKPAWLAEFAELWSQQLPRAARPTVDLLVEAGLVRPPADPPRGTPRLRLVSMSPQPAGASEVVAEQLERLAALGLAEQCPTGVGLVAVRVAAQQGRVPDIGELPPVLSVALPPPITDPAELVELFGVLIETDGNPVLVQRVLAAAVRTAGLPLRDRAARMAPLLERAWARSVPHADTAGRHPGWSYLAALAFSWGTGWRLDYRHFEPQGGGRGEWISSPDYLPPSRLSGVFGLQVAECTQLISAGIGRQLLSEPTHLCGGVEPGVLLQRLHSLGRPAAGPAAPAVQLDVELAALRLPRDLDEDFWRQARAGCAAVAERLREHHTEQRQPALIPVVGVPSGTYLYQRDQGKPIALAEIADGVPDTGRTGVWSVLTDLHGAISRFERIMSTFGFFEYDQQAAMWSMIAPWHHELLSAHLLMPLARALQAGNSSAPSAATVIDSPTGAFGPIAHLALVVALQGGAAETRAIAADAWLATAGDGRLQPRLLADALVLLGRGGALKLDRVVETIRPTTYEPITGYRTLQAFTAALPELLVAEPPELLDAIELVGELAGRYGTELIPAEVRELAAGRPVTPLVEAARRLAALRSDAPDRPLAVEAALEGLLGRLSGLTYSYMNI